MVANAAIEAVLELLSSAFDRSPESAPPAPVADTEAPPLTPGEQELAAAIQTRRGVLSATAEDLVKWLRSQHWEREP